MRANLKSISYGRHLFEVAFVWTLTQETIHLPLGCLQGGIPTLGMMEAASSVVSIESIEFQSHQDQEQPVPLTLASFAFGVITG